jgi:hypothetical protein
MAGKGGFRLADGQGSSEYAPRGRTVLVALCVAHESENAVALPFRCAGSIKADVFGSGEVRGDAALNDWF